MTINAEHAEHAEAFVRVCRALGLPRQAARVERFTERCVQSSLQTRRALCCTCRGCDPYALERRATSQRSGLLCRAAERPPEGGRYGFCSTTATPQGPRPSGIFLLTCFVSRSTTDRSFDGPLAV